LLNNILAKIQANLAGVADAIMLDVEGYVSETNATNLFMVNEGGVLLTPHADHCLPGVTRQTVLELAKELGIATEVRRISLAEFHAASEGKVSLAGSCELTLKAFLTSHVDVLQCSRLERWAH
jgi:protein-lysine N-methyltransferase EEF2KMT